MSNGRDMRDRDVRNALRTKVLAQHYRDSETLVLDELGLYHGAARIDLAVVNGRLHGFEIKSDADTLDRLPAQVQFYRPVFDRVTVVCGECHTREVEQLTPNWWGIKQACSGARGAVHFQEVRAPRDSDEIDAVSVARLLWRNEVINLLEQAGVTRGHKSKSRDALYRMLAECMPLNGIRDAVRSALRAREDWRSGAAHRPDVYS